MIALNVIFKYLSLVGSFTTIGSLLAMSFLLLDTQGRLSTQGEKLRRLLWGSAILWSVGSFGTIVFTLATILDQPVSVALDATVLRSFITQITLGQYLLFEAIVGLVIAVFAFRVKKILSAAFMLVLALLIVQKITTKRFSLSVDV